MTAPATPPVSPVPPPRTTRRTRGAPPDDDIAALVQRLGVLLTAGVTPSNAWAHLAALPAASAAVRGVADAVAQGEQVPRAVLAQAVGAGSAAWRGLAAAWAVAAETGAPLASTLDSFARALRDANETKRACETALAAPAATARLVAALPVIGVLFGLGLGFDMLGTLFTTPAGLACLGAGLLLMFAARQWNTRLLRAARHGEPNPGLILDLIAVAVTGGAPLDRAVATVETALERCRIPGDIAAATTVLELSRRAGVPAATLLRAEAEEQRRDARARGERTAARLGVTLMLPLGLCILPAFMLLGVVPLMISVVTSSLGGF